MILNSTSDAGLLSRLANNSSGLRAMLDTTLAQQSTGKIAPDYAGLGTGTRTSLDLRPAVQHQQVWQNNIDAATGRLDVAQTAMKQIATIAADFYARTNNINDVGVSQAGSIAAGAKLALQQVGQLLNTKSGDIYVFAGQDTANAPVPDTDPAVLGTALLASDTAAAPFSATIGTAVPQVEVGEGQFVQTGLLATRNTLAVSPAPTTGSYMRDIMRGLANLATLTDTSPNAVSLAADTRSRLGSAITAIAAETGSLGDVQQTLNTRKTTLATVQTTLSAQVSNVEDVDMAATLSRVSALQTQLQASYQVIAGIKDLSLSKYL
jgi:flagellar hook-associated protein 3 FlgL